MGQGEAEQRGSDDPGVKSRHCIYGMNIGKYAFRNDGVGLVLSFRYLLQFSFARAGPWMVMSAE